MFKLVKERTAWWPVTWQVPTEDGGETEEARIELQFRLIGLDDLQPIMKEAEAVDLREQAPSARLAEVLARIVADWRGVGDESGVQAPFTTDTFRHLLNMPGSFAAIMSAYRDCLAGVVKAREGN